MTTSEGGNGVRPAARQVNQSVVLRAVLRHGPLPRVEIASLTGLSGASVTRITKELVEAHVLRSLDVASGGRQGAPRVPIEVHTGQHAALGIHLGQRRANLGLVNLRGDVIDRVEYRYKTTGRKSILDGVRKHAARLVQRAPTGTTVIGTGISVGGWVDSSTGTVIENPGLDWQNVSLVDFARSAGPEPLFITSTWRGLALKELTLGHTSHARDFLLLFVGNTIGAAIVLDARIQHGAHAGAGKVAHMAVSRRGPRCPECGKTNCFVAVAGDQALRQRAAQRCGLPDDASDEELVDFVASVDPTTRRQLLRPRALAIGEMLGTLMDILDPESVMLADPFFVHDDYRETIEAEASRVQPRNGNPLQIVHAYPDSVLSAAIGVLDNFYRNPLEAVQLTPTDLTPRSGDSEPTAGRQRPGG